MMSASEELRKDVDELKQLLEQAKRKKVIDLLGLEIRKLETEIFRRVEQEQSCMSARVGETGDASESSPSAGKPTAQIKPIYTRPIDSYGWDQSDKFLKIYVTIQGVENVPTENVQSEFRDRDFKLRVNELDNFNYELRIVNLLHPVVPNDSYVKVKTGSVLVMLKKAETGKSWSHVTQQEAKIKGKAEPPKPDVDDPNAGMMNLLQKMYDDGDDDMKRTISKAMYESRNKSGAAPPML